MELGKVEEKQKNIWISTTAYRIFLVLKSLLISQKTTDELISIIANDHILKKIISKDTLRFDINTLKNAGCKIARPTKTNNYKYQLISHPFNLNISIEELNLLFELRKNLASEISLADVITLNELYDKIAYLTLDNNKILEFSSSKPLFDVSLDILKEIINPNIIGKKVRMSYNSPKFGIEDIDIVPVKILYENNKVYISAYNYKYDTNSFFEASRIKKIYSISIEKEIIENQEMTVLYEVIGEAVKDFKLKYYEKIIEKTENKILVEAQVNNEFMFTQRLLLLGRNFKIIFPDVFRKKLIDKIKLIQKRYVNE